MLKLSFFVAMYAVYQYFAARNLTNGNYKTAVFYMCFAVFGMFGAISVFGDLLLEALRFLTAMLA